MAIRNEKNQLRTRLEDALRIAQTKVETAPTSTEFSIATKEFEFVKQAVDDSDRVIGVNPVPELKRIMNTLVLINRLPVELFTHIILLTHTSMQGTSHPYLFYTWVCHHWRSVLIHTSAFWTLVRYSGRYPYPYSEASFDRELFRRSNAAKLDIILSGNSLGHVSMLHWHTFFITENSRVRKVIIDDPHPSLIQAVSAAERLPFLQGFSFIVPAKDCFVLDRLLPILITSDHLETLECTLQSYNNPLDQLAIIFKRIRNLSIHLPSHTLSAKVLCLLHNVTLKTLKLRVIGSTLAIPSRITLPELQHLSIDDASLMEPIRAPKLLSLDVNWKCNLFAPDCSILETFDFSTIKYLYVRCPQSVRKVVEEGYCILGSKERIHCESLFSSGTDILFADTLCHSHHPDGFHIKFETEYTFTNGLRQVTSTILPRLTNLVDLYLLFPLTLADLRAILTQVPSVEKVVVQRGSKLIDFIRLIGQTTVCPRLKHMSFTTFLLPKDLEKYATDVGKTLTSCIESRREDSADMLKYIALRNCPPLPAIWLDQLQQLGTEVVTEKDIKDVVIKNPELKKKYLKEELSDVEI